jgi:ABC-type nitrate/sulfonate/bicarbonate transport system substrate-binding protein
MVAALPLISLALGCLSTGPALAEKAEPSGQVTLTSLAEHNATVGDAQLRIGYFHGGRNLLVYRALNDGVFDRADVAMSLWATRSDEDPEFYMMPPNLKDLEHYRTNATHGSMLGRTTGIQLTEQLNQGRIDCAMIGESSFLLMAKDGIAATAVAKLGQDQVELPGKVVLVLEELELQGPSDFAGLTIGSRKGGPYDAIMVREFLEGRGVDIATMTVLDNIPQLDLRSALKKNEIDIVFLHLNRATRAIAYGGYKLLPGFAFSFANPKLSHAILVCRDDVIKARREPLVRFLTGYKERIDFENSLSREARSKFDGHKTLGMDNVQFPGFNLPQYDPEPLVDPVLLDEMQALMIKHGHLPGEVPFRDHIDMSLMEEALARHAPPTEKPRVHGAAERTLAVLDSNHNGQLSQAEVTQASFGSLPIGPFDSDHDGELNAAEFEALLWKLDPLTTEYRGRRNKIRTEKEAKK